MKQQIGTLPVKTMDKLLKKQREEYIKWPSNSIMFRKKKKLKS